MKIISSKILAAMLVVLMLCMLLPSAALAAELSGSITKDDRGLTTYTTASGANAILLKKQTLAVIWTEVELDEAEKETVKSAFANKDTSWKTLVGYISGYKTHDLSNVGNGAWGSWTFTKNADGSVTLSTEDGDALSHIDYGTFTGLTNQPSGPVAPVDPVDPVDPDPTPTPEKKSEPSMDKDISADGEKYEEYNLENAVAPGTTVYFKLTSNLPEALETAINEDENTQTKTMNEGQKLTFTDTMSSNLTLNANSVAVKIGTESVDSQYYTMSDVTESTDGKTFTVELNLTALYNAGKITDDDIGVADRVTVTYNATVSASAVDQETFENEAYATYNNKDSVHSTVTGTVTKPEDPTPTPETGGAGTTLFTVGGLGLMAVAGALLLRRRQDA